MFVSAKGKFIYLIPRQISTEGQHATILRD